MARGKSTLIKNILGLLAKESGEINLKIPTSEISYLPQVNEISLNFPATVLEVVLTGTQRKEKRLPTYSKQDKENALKAIKMLGIQNIMNKRIGDLSGGQRQRALLARAICKAPKLLILDEPCSGLDQSITKQVYRIINDLNKTGVTIIMSTHDIDDVKEYATRVVILNKKVEFDGTIDEWEKQYKKEDK